MSSTTYDIDFLTGCAELLPNLALSQLMLEKLQAVGDLSFTAEEQAFAKQLKHLHRDAGCSLDRPTQVRTSLIGRCSPRCGSRSPHVETAMVMPGSTEVGDVSQITPLGS